MPEETEVRLQLRYTEALSCDVVSQRIFARCTLTNEGGDPPTQFVINAVLLGDAVTHEKQWAAMRVELFVALARALRLEAPASNGNGGPYAHSMEVRR